MNALAFLIYLYNIAVFSGAGFVLGRWFDGR